MASHSFRNSGRTLFSTTQRAKCRMLGPGATILFLCDRILSQKRSRQRGSPKTRKSTVAIMYTNSRRLAQLPAFRHIFFARASYPSPHSACPSQRNYASHRITLPHPSICHRARPVLPSPHTPTFSSIVLSLSFVVVVVVPSPSPISSNNDCICRYGYRLL